MFKLYNTMTRRKDPFSPQDGKSVKMYVCGPTVYNYTHIGNLKAFINADTVRRYLAYIGYSVHMIKNITDVGHLTNDDISQGDSGDDKIVREARKQQKTPQEIARFYEAYFHKCEKKLNIVPAEVFPRATEHIGDIITLVEKLIANGHAYEANGNVFYDVTSFPSYGILSGNSLNKLKVGARIETEHPDKKNQWDFALWLKAPEEHLMKWESPWGIGYPGWHIECSAMSMRYLGEMLDIHTGGEDHIFPHHEAEIAQSEGVTGKAFCRWWIHERHMLIAGVKMAKSKGNFYTLDDIENMGFSAMDFRVLILSSHYRSQMNFTRDALVQAKKNRQRMEMFYEHLKDATLKSQGTHDPSRVSALIREFQEKFDSAMNDDLNTPQAFSDWYEFISTVYTLATISPQDAHTLLALWENINSVFGILFEETEVLIPENVATLVSQRQAAREDKNFALSDILRDKIIALGYSIEDTPSGQRVRKQ